MNWIQLEDLAQLEEIKEDAGYSVIFKHSTRCSISMMAKKRVDMELDDLPASVKPYFLNLLAHRDISNEVAESFSVHHQSPQLLLIKDGECILNQSHGEVSIEETLGLIKE